ncbi:MAG: AMP-binding protein [Pseudomonadota bacterium]|nr:AMP-binding protein [Pseudomonadota bacterium]
MGSDLYEELHADFRWLVPPHFNLAEVCSARWARETPLATAIRFEHEDGSHRQYSYAELQAAAERSAAALSGLGVRAGDRVALVMPQRFEMAVAYLAVWRLGAIAVPLSMLFGPEALEYRINDSGAEVIVVDEAGIGNVMAVRPSCAGLRGIVAVGAAEGQGDARWSELLAAETGGGKLTATLADDPAVLIYTSGTTGPPKGTLIPHRALIGNLPGFVCSQNWFPQDDAVFWSPADWAWTGGLMDALLPTLYFGRPIVAYQGRFSADVAFALLQRHRVTHAFLFPTALKAMMKAEPTPRARYRLHLRALMSAGEAVGDAVFAYCRDALGVTANEMFGQTEMNYIVGNCALLWPARPGSMGRPYPGHRVAVLDDAGDECPRGVPGDVALHRRDIHGERDPIFFLGYWNRDDATRDKFTGDVDASWCRSGDTAVMDEAGYLWYQGRSDDVFKSAGYRIGPSEIENCLVKHAAVGNAAVVPKPDAERGSVVKAFVVLAPGHSASAELIAELQAHVRGKLAPYEYPKEIEFVEALPMTTTGKVQRRVLRLLETERARAACGVT